jgi:hypothetical protein
MRTSSTSLLTLSLLPLALAACGDDPPSPTEVRTAIHDDLGYVLHEGKAASDASTANLPSTSVFSLATVDPTGGAARVLAPLTDRITTAVKNRQSLTGDSVTMFDPDAITMTLEQELFTDANYLGDGVYRVPASMVCETTVYNPDGSTTQSIDPDCAAQLDKIQLRVRVASEDGGIRFYIQLDANHDEPLSIFLAHDKLAITINLDDATDAMIALAQIEGQQAPNADLSGSITGSLQILGAAHARVALSFDRAISIKLADQGLPLDGPDATRFTSAAAQVIDVELDGNAPKAKLALGLGETTAHIPGDATLVPAEPARDVDLGGFTVSASFQGNTLSLDNISLGSKTTTVSVGGQQAVAIDLNPNNGRSLSATIVADPATGSEELHVTPRLEIVESINHTLLGDEPPVYDVTHVLLDGVLRGSDASTQVQVVSGSFAIETNPAQYGFSASAGQCVSGTDTYDSTTYTYFTQYSVGACL